METASAAMATACDQLLDVVGLDVRRGIYELSHDVRTLSLHSYIVFIIVANMLFFVTRRVVVMLSHRLSAGYRTFEARAAAGDTDAKKTVIAWNNRGVSILHGALSAISAGIAVYHSSPSTLFEAEPWFGSTPVQLVAVWLTCAFMIHDGFFMFIRIGLSIPSFGDFLLLLHHVLVAFIFSSAPLQTPATGLLAMCVYQLFEVSTPFLGFRWMLLKLGKENDLIYKINGLIFLVMFFLSRVVLNSVIVYSLIFYIPQEAVNVVYVEYYLAFPFSAMQYYWFYEILMIAIRPRKPYKKD